ncbi:MAG: 50S ribosomal protein L10, partial [Acidimicrobiia bacterium]|nr:50S ribosomal protein L10 [Acidimicrobiia bacterium]
MARPEKVATVAEIRDRIAESDATVLTEYRGLTVSQLANLRSALRPAGTDLKIYKNTLARRAANEAGVEDLVPMLQGPTAIAFIKGDAVLAAKALRDFAKTAEAFVIKGGMLGSRFISAAEVSELAEVAPREELLARIAGAFQGPLVKAAGLFQAIPRNLAYGVKALIEQRVANGEALPEEAAAEATTSEAPTSEAPAPEETSPEAVEVEAAPETAEAAPESAEPEA